MSQVRAGKKHGKDLGIGSLYAMDRGERLDRMGFYPTV